MANKQPFYHSCLLIFTATKELTEEELKEAISDGLNHFPQGTVLLETIEVEDLEAEPGDPHDLL